MTARRDLDCVIIGYNDVPFEKYESWLRGYGEDSEAYRDFQLSFVEVEGEKKLYADLMNHTTARARGMSNGDVPQVFKSGDIPNLAAAYLTNFLARRGHRAKYVNLFQDEKAYLDALLAQRPHCVAITTTFYVLNLPVVDMVEYIRSKSDEVKIVVGGPLVANHQRNYEGEEFEAALHDLGADVYVVEGQGELTLHRLVECLKNGGDLSRVPNLIYREGRRIHRTSPEPEFNDMDENYIDWKGLAAGNEMGPTLQTRTARSCAFNCAFCNYPTRAGKLTLTSLETLERELESMHQLGSVRNVVFIDDTFNVPLPRFKDICRLLIEKKYGFNWFSYFRCSNSDEEAVELMAESGCKGVFLGIESGSPTILKNMNKHATIEKYAKGIELLKAHGVITFGSFITGFPGETDATVQETIDFVRTYKPDFFRSQLWYCEEGTPITQDREKYGIEGDGFVWSHDTMESLEAMEWIERIFLSVEDSVWLPQWSFDFWILPYLMGKGVDMGDFRDYMKLAKQMMALHVAAVPEREKAQRHDRLLAQMVDVSRRWDAVA